MGEYRILITGSRDWDDRLTIYRAINKVCVENDLNYPPDEYGNTMPDPEKVRVVHGHCPTGADHWADEWCIGNYFMAERHPADWKRYGSQAGFIRNSEMVKLGADICLAFIKDRSKGATHTADTAEKAGIEVLRYREPLPQLTLRHGRVWTPRGR